MQNLDTNEKTVRKLQKIKTHTNFLSIVSLVISIITFGLAVTADLWRGKIFPAIDNTATIITNLENVQKKINNTAKLIESSVVMAQNAMEKSLNSEKISTELVSRVNKLQAVVKAKIEIEAGNERLMQIRQIGSVALLGEPYNLLMKGIEPLNDVEKNAIQILNKNFNGIASISELITYLNNNVRILAPKISDVTATTIMGKIKARLNNLIYIRKTNAVDNIKQPTIELLISLTSSNNLNELLKVLNALNLAELNEFKAKIERRKTVIDSLTLLVKGAI